MTIQRAAYSVSEIVARYGISRSTVNRMIREGLIPSTKMLGRRLIDAQGFERAFRTGVAPKPKCNRDGNRDARSRRFSRR